MKVNFTEKAVLSRSLILESMFLQMEALIKETFNCSLKDFEKALKEEKLDISIVESMESNSDARTITLAYLVMLQQTRSLLKRLEKYDYIARRVCQISGVRDLLL